MLGAPQSNNTQKKVEKARYCVKCKSFLPVECFTDTQFPVAQCNVVCNRHDPEKNGLQYCKGCDDFIALDLFPRGSTLGFACRKHVNEYGGGREAKRKQLIDVEKKRRIYTWKNVTPTAKYSSKEKSPSARTR